MTLDALLDISIASFPVFMLIIIGKLPALPFPSTVTLFDMETLPRVVVAFVASAISTVPLAPMLGDTLREALFESDMLPFTQTGPASMSEEPLVTVRSPSILFGPSVREPDHEYGPAITPPARAAASHAAI